MNVVITPSAAAKISDLLAENPEQKALRVFVQGGGCSGFQYGFSFENEIQEDDFHINEIIVVDVMSAQYLEGATIDYVEELMGSHFSINNPNATTTCGCGSSFGV